MLPATLVLGAGLGASGAAHAADDATLNQCWGETTKQFAQVDDGQSGIGEHSSAPPGARVSWGGGVLSPWGGRASKAVEGGRRGPPRKRPPPPPATQGSPPPR